MIWLSAEFLWLSGQFWVSLGWIWVSNDKKAMPPTFEEATMPNQTPTFQIIETSSTTIDQRSIPNS